MKARKPPLIVAYTDPRRRCISLSARAVYDEIIRLAESLKSPSVRFASSIPSTNELAKILACDEIELAEAVICLRRVGLLGQCDDGAISVPALERYFERSDINRANGLRGGRPKKAVKGS